MWLKEPFVEGMSVTIHCLGSKAQLGSQFISQGYFLSRELFLGCSQREGRKVNVDMSVIEVHCRQNTNSPGEGTAVSVPLGHYDLPMRFCCWMLNCF